MGTVFELSVFASHNFGAENADSRRAFAEWRREEKVLSESVDSVERVGGNLSCMHAGIGYGPCPEPCRGRLRLKAPKGSEETRSERTSEGGETRGPFVVVEVVDANLARCRLSLTSRT